MRYLVPLAFLFGTSSILLAQTNQTPATAKTYVRPKAPPVELHWIDAKGNIASSAKAQTVSWTWSYRLKTDKTKTPALRVWIKTGFSADWKPTLISTESATVIKPPTSGTDEIIIDLRSTKNTLRYKYDKPDGTHTELTLVLEVNVGKAYVFSTPECNEADLFFKIQKNESKHLYMGISCIDNGDTIDLYAIRSEDSLWNKDTQAVQIDPQNKMFEMKHRVYKSKETIIYTKTFLHGGTEDELGGKTEYHVLYAPKDKPKRFYMSAGAGFTYLTYKERATSVNLVQNSLTGKVNAGYRLIPKLLDVAMNVFATLYTVSYTHTTSADGGVPFSSARFYGINGRLGYRLPLELGATELMFLTGWYLWRMTVSATTRESIYGINTLSGPQLFFMAVNTPSGKRGFWGYTKLALISDNLKINHINNREIAFGGGVQLSAKERKPWSATLDVAHARFFNQDTGMTMMSVTLGLQKGI